MLTKWTNINNCPSGYFYAILKKGVRFRIKLVYVHEDNHFLVWKELRTKKEQIGIAGWKCIYYFN